MKYFTPERDVIKIFETELLDYLPENTEYLLFKRNNKVYYKDQNGEQLLNDFINTLDASNKDNFIKAVKKQIYTNLVDTNKEIQNNLKNTIIECRVLDTSANTVEVEALERNIIIPKSNFAKSDIPTVNSTIFFALERSFIDNNNNINIVLTRRGIIFLKSFINTYITTALENIGLDASSIVKFNRVEGKFSAIVYQKPYEQKQINSLLFLLEGFSAKYRELVEEPLYFFDSREGVESTIRTLLSSNKSFYIEEDELQESITIICHPEEYYKFLGKRGEVVYALSSILQRRIHIKQRDIDE